MSFRVPNQFRFKSATHPYGSDDSIGNYGAFNVPFESYVLRVLASEGGGDLAEWEHVSVSLTNRCPNWREMSYVKDLFWDAEDCVIQYHPPKSIHINNFPYCLHLWKPKKEVIPMPPIELV